MKISIRPISHSSSIHPYRILGLIVISVFFILDTYAQRNLPLNREWSLAYEKANMGFELSQDSATANDPALKQFHSSFRPYIVKTSRQEIKKSKSWAYRKLTKESLFIAHDSTDKF